MDPSEQYIFYPCLLNLIGLIIFVYSVSESKLNRLKGKTSTSAKNLNSKDMLKSLHQAKEDAIKRLTANDTPVITDTILDSRDDLEVSDFKRRVFPEQPLNAEEIQTLTERDYLGTLVQTLQEEQSSKNETEEPSSDTT